MVNVPYSYSYLFAYPIDLPSGVKKISLPSNDKIRTGALLVAEENPDVKPVQPLYDTLGTVGAGTGGRAAITGSLLDMHRAIMLVCMTW